MQAKDFDQDAPLVYIYFFGGDGCPHCAEAKSLLQELVQRYPNVQVESFEVRYDADNQVLFQQMAAAHGHEPHYVPTIFIGEQYWAAPRTVHRVTSAGGPWNCSMRIPFCGKRWAER